MLVSSVLARGYASSKLLLNLWKYVQKRVENRIKLNNNFFFHLLILRKNISKFTLNPTYLVYCLLFTLIVLCSRSHKRLKFDFYFL